MSCRRSLQFSPQFSPQFSQALISACLAGTALLAPDPAVAQSAPPASPASAVVALPEVTVSARRTPELAQETPVAVTTVSGEALDRGRGSSFEDVARLSPSTVFSPQGGPFTIRGVGSMGMDGGIDRQLGVGLFLDDVYVGRPGAFPTLLTDVGRVEVIRGPQTTLYGKNTIGGAVTVVTPDAGAEPAASVDLRLGTGNERAVRGSVSTPLANGNVRARASFASTQRDGYIDNRTTGGKDADTGTYSGRIGVTSFAGEDTTLRLTADYERDADDGGIPFVPLSVAKKRESILDAPAKRSADRGGAALKVDHDLPGATLTSISAFRGFQWDMVLDGDFSATPMLLQGQDERQWQVSQEVKLASVSPAVRSAGDLRWQAGLFYLHEDFKGSQTYDMASVSQEDASRNALDVTTETFSAFGDLGYAVTPAVEVSAGLRYTRDIKDGTATVSSPSGNNFFGTPATASGRRTDDALSPEVGLTWTVSPQVMAYGKVSRGFKAGGISQFLEAGGKANSYDPETSWSYEIGSKTDWADGRLTVNVAAFYTDWKNQQARVAVNPALPTLRVIDNAAAATSYGAELEAAARLNEEVTLTLGYGWLRAQYDTFRVAATGADYSGHQTPFSPRHTLTADLAWQHPVGAGLTLFASTTPTLRSSYTFDPEGAYRQPAAFTVNAEAGVKGEGWSLSLWGRNLTDETVLKGYFRSNGQDYGVAEDGAAVGLTAKAVW